jgi:hypothetical protein
MSLARRAVSVVAIVVSLALITWAYKVRSAPFENNAPASLTGTNTHVGQSTAATREPLDIAAPTSTPTVLETDAHTVADERKPPRGLRVRPARGENEMDEGDRHRDAPPPAGVARVQSEPRPPPMQVLNHRVLLPGDSAEERHRRIQELIADRRRAASERLGRRM